VTKIDDKFSIMSDLKACQDQLAQQETDYVANIAEIDDWVNNQATKRETAKVNYLNYCVAAKGLLEDKVRDNASEISDEMTEVTDLIAAYGTKITELSS
jgi:hypothetical protein